VLGRELNMKLVDSRPKILKKNMVKGFWRGESRVMEKREDVFKLSTFLLFEFAGKKLSKNNLFKWFLCVMFNEKY
jgi:hypothetical protein